MPRPKNTPPPRPNTLRPAFPARLDGTQRNRGIKPIKKPKQK